MPPENFWNFDETGTKLQHCDEFKHGLKGARQNQTEQHGSGENVTMGLFASLTGQHVGPIFVCTGADTNLANMRRKVVAAGVPDASPLLKRGEGFHGWQVVYPGLGTLLRGIEAFGCTGKRILMLDNHDSHERSAPIARAIADGVVTITLPSHCSSAFASSWGVVKTAAEGLVIFGSRAVGRWNARPCWLST